MISFLPACDQPQESVWFTEGCKDVMWFSNIYTNISGSIQGK